MSNRLSLTMEDTVGPYYPPSFVDDEPSGRAFANGTVTVPQGKPLVIEGRVLEEGGGLVAPVLLEFWHADANGHSAGHPLADPWLASPIRRYAKDGRYRLETIMPGATSPGRAPHVTVTIFCDGVAKVLTQVYFAGQASNTTDALLASLPEDLRTRLIARAATEGSTFHHDIVLRGEGETPFFDDWGW